MLACFIYDPKKSFPLFLTLIICLQAIVVNCQTHYYSWKDYTPDSTLPQFKQATNLVTGDSGKVYFIAKDGRVCEYETATNLGSFNYLSSGILYQNALQNTGLEYRDRSLFFVNESGEISRFYFSGNLPEYQVLNSAAPKVLLGTQISADENRVFYVNIEGRICYLNYDNGVWNNKILSSSNPSQKGKKRTDIEYRNQSLFFVNELGHISRFHFSDGIWKHEVLDAAAPIVRSGTSITTDPFGKVYFIGSDQKVYCFWFDELKWRCDVLSSHAPKAKAYTDLLYDNNRIFYVSVENRINILYFDECKWNFTCLNSKSKVAAYSGLALVKNNSLYYVNSVSKKVHTLSPKITDNHPFVYIKGKNFYSGNTAINLKVINYIVDINTNDNENYWASPHISYDTRPSERLCKNKRACLNLLKMHFQNIKSLGFSAIRIVGIGANPATNSADSGLYTRTITSDPAYSFTATLTDKSFEKKLFMTISEVLDCADSAGLKVILLTGSGGNKNTFYHKAYSRFLGNLSEHLKNNTTLMAYDIYNEPASQNTLSKSQACSAADS